MPNIITKIININELTELEKKYLFIIMDKYYLNVEENIFFQDLNEKDKIIVLYDSRSGIIKGFSTFKIIDTKLEKTPIKAIFSGDTIIEKECWGNMELVKAFGGVLFNLAIEKNEALKYWLLISKGYKTYRYLPTFFNNYHPRLDHEDDPWEMAVKNKLMSVKYPDKYDHETGIIYLGKNAQCVKPGIADITEKKLKNPHIKFFTEKNPGYHKGDELVCLTKLTLDNFAQAFYEAATK